MQSLSASIADYERWMRAWLDGDVVEPDLDKKHELMRESPFLFLRATCWRWAEAAAVLCPDLADAPAAPSVGDAHVGNFGLWRDARARLVWGINDFDEAARLPFTLDLVRLGASILLADKSADAGDVARALLQGYRKGLDAPTPWVLERRHLWLRDAFAASDSKRKKFWRELDDAPEATAIARGLREPLLRALPDAASGVRVTPRSVGAGSLGRPRFVASGEHRGGPVAAEIKARLPSCWERGGTTGLAQHIAHGRCRAPDSKLHYEHGYVLRRLAPNSRKLNLEELTPQLHARLTRAMGAELAAVHVDTDAGRDAIRADLAQRPRRWLREAAARVADWTAGEHRAYRAGG
ncbi:MAG: DUF2252 family protein [Sphingomonas sp.]